MNKAVFLDRDGVINVDHGYVGKQDDFDFIDGVFEACRKLKEMGYLLVLVTNQSGIGRGYYSEDDFHTLTEWMDWNFVDKGVEFDGIYYCPHHPEKALGDYKQVCDCRKPNTGMLDSAQRHLKIDMANSIMIGDSLSDMQAAIKAEVAHRYLVTEDETKLEQAADMITGHGKSLFEIVKSL